MVKLPIFVVSCQRVNKTKWYQVRLSRPNDTMNDRIRALGKKEHRFNTDAMCWELTVEGLFTLMSYYKGSTKLKFDFGEDKNDFLNQIKQIHEKERKLKQEKLKLEANKKEWKKFKEILETDHSKEVELVHKNLNSGVRLYPFQVVAALFLNKVKNALLSLEMGLGKTLSSIAYVEMNDFEKVFVITPNSLKHNFYHEVEKFTESKAHIVNWNKNKYSIEESKYIIVNYEFFNPKDKKKMDKKFKELNIEKINCVIADESHRLKNPSSNTYKNYKRIFTEDFFINKIVSKVYLSGTPAPNRAHELYTILNQISPIEFPTKQYFYEVYCGMVYDPEVRGGWSRTNRLNLELLYENITPYTYRKRKQDVLTDLPDKIYQKILLDLDDIEKIEYDVIESDVVDNIIEQSSSNPLTIMLRLRQFTSQCKASRIKDIIDSIIDTGDKLVIVDMFKEVLYEINKMYPKISEVHTGDQTVEERNEIVERFQDPNSETKIFLGSIQTCNYGLTLTAANKLLIITLPYSVGEYDQVSDRLHRIGQKDTVNIYPLIFTDTIDEDVFSIIESKRKEINKVIDNEDYESDISESVIGELIQKLKEKHGKTV